MEPLPTVNSLPPPGRPPARRVSSLELLQGRMEVLILHQGQEYRLRLTKNGKLILTK